MLTYFFICSQVAYQLRLQNPKGRKKIWWSLNIHEQFEALKTIPGTFWMIFATKALKWHRISFRVSESFSFSASRSCLVKSTYSNKVLLRKCVSLSRPPLALKILKKTHGKNNVILSYNLSQNKFPIIKIRVIYIKLCIVKFNLICKKKEWTGFWLTEI